ncbi:MAG: M23 family metallopeptidase [Balneolaceae bacterium]|nr:M23 family metallopeptidase [Balneolaceae bacterium]
MWPTNASPYLSGSFAETRSQHFHAALDIKTWGRRGYDVYATRDGRLHRIAIGPGGYGKAIYLKHDDGSYSVYAHLLSFEKEIQQLADSIRFTNYSNDLDQIVDSLDIRVKQGELIGYSGATGIGPPHLHFELRTPTEKPFNPLLTNLSIPDDIPPRFSGLAIEPLSPESRIKGKNEIELIEPQRRSGIFDFGTVEVQGPVGLAVDIYDQANRVYNAYAVYDLKLMLENEMLFHSRVDSFSYNETGQLFLDRIYPILQNRGSAYQRLHVVDGNSLSFYKSSQNKGRLNLSPGSYDLRIIAEDFFGNSSEARVTIQVLSPSEQESIYVMNGSNGTNGQNSSYRPYNRTNFSNEWDWHDRWINLNGRDTLGYTVVRMNRGKELARTEQKNPYSFLSLNEADLTVIQGRSNHSEQLHLYQIPWGEKMRIHSTRIQAYATFGPETHYDTLSVALTGKVHRADSVQIDLYPHNRPLKGSFELTYVLQDSVAEDSTMAFYEYEKRRNRLSYVPTRKGGPILKGEAEKLGRYFVLRDTTAPEIRRPRIMKRADGTWVGLVEAEDLRSGIDHHTAEFYINGIRGIAEFEPEDDRILYYHPDFGPTSSYTFQVSVSDMMGNKTEKEFEIR